VRGYSGLTVNFCHEINAQVIVRGLRVFSDFEYEFRMALANHSLAPDIEVVALITNKDHSFLSGSTVREIASLGGDVSAMVPEVVDQALKKRFQELGKDQNVVPQTSLRD
jgi:pantetheine-phosphate adenylyltransferase